jgi:hypothetical protein
MKPKTKRMFSGVTRYHKFDVATGQLETAIRLFLMDGCDMFSAVTLAGAAGGILSQLVLDAGKRPFVDFAIKTYDWRKLGPTVARSALMTHINKILFINALKHHDPKDDEFVEFDAEEAALAAILKAVADYKTLTGTETEAMKAFLAWCYLNLESDQIMEEYKKLPEKAKNL